MAELTAARRALRDGALHVEALATMVRARRGLRRAGLEPTLRRLARDGARWGRRMRGPDLVPIVERVRHVIGDGTCLEESVAMAAVLTRHGRHPELVLGCRRLDDASWGAHAWILVDGARIDLLPGVTHLPLATYADATNWSAHQLHGPVSES